MEGSQLLLQVDEVANTRSTGVGGGDTQLLRIAAPWGGTGSLETDACTC